MVKPKISYMDRSYTHTEDTQWGSVNSSLEENRLINNVFIEISKGKEVSINFSRRIMV